MTLSEMSADAGHPKLALVLLDEVERDASDGSSSVSDDEAPA